MELCMFCHLALAEADGFCSDICRACVEEIEAMIRELNALSDEEIEELIEAERMREAEEWFLRGLEDDE